MSLAEVILRGYGLRTEKRGLSDIARISARSIHGGFTGFEDCFCYEEEQVKGL